VNPSGLADGLMVRNSSRTRLIAGSCRACPSLPESLEVTSSMASAMMRQASSKSTSHCFARSSAASSAQIWRSTASLKASHISAVLCRGPVCSRAVRSTSRCSARVSRGPSGERVSRDESTADLLMRSNSSANVGATRALRDGSPKDGAPNKPGDDALEPLAPKGSADIGDGERESDRESCRDGERERPTARLGVDIDRQYSWSRV